MTNPGLQALHGKIVDDVADGLAVRAADVRGIVPVAAAPMMGLVGTSAAIESVVRALLNMAAERLGPRVTEDVVAHKETVRRLIGPPVLEMLDTIIHGLEDVKAQAQAQPPAPGA